MSPRLIPHVCLTLQMRRPRGCCCSVWVCNCNQKPPGPRRPRRPGVGDAMEKNEVGVSQCLRIHVTTCCRIHLTTFSMQAGAVSSLYITGRGRELLVKTLCTALKELLVKQLHCMQLGCWWVFLYSFGFCLIRWTLSDSSFSEMFLSAAVYQHQADTPLLHVEEPSMAPKKAAVKVAAKAPATKAKAAAKGPANKGQVAPQVVPKAPAPGPTDGSAVSRGDTSRVLMHLAYKSDKEKNKSGEGLVEAQKALQACVFALLSHLFLVVPAKLNPIMSDLPCPQRP